MGQQLNPLNDLPIEHATPKTLERWFKPGRTPSQTALLRMFEKLPGGTQDYLIGTYKNNGAIPGEVIAEAYACIMAKDVSSSEPAGK